MVDLICNRKKYPQKKDWQETFQHGNVSGYFGMVEL